MKQHNYFVYITTNPGKTVLYIGVTNHLAARLAQTTKTGASPKRLPGDITATSCFTGSVSSTFNTPLPASKN